MNLKCDILVSKFAFKWVNLYRYIEDAISGATHVKNIGTMEREMSPSWRAALRAKDRATDVSAREAAASAKRLSAVWRRDRDRR